MAKLQRGATRVQTLLWFLSTYGIITILPWWEQKTLPMEEQLNCICFLMWPSLAYIKSQMVWSTKCTNYTYSYLVISEEKLLIGNVIKISWLPLVKPAGESVILLRVNREPSNSNLLYCHLPSDWFAQNEDEQSPPSAQILALQIMPQVG